MNDIINTRVCLRNAKVIPTMNITPVTSLVFGMCTQATVHIIFLFRTKRLTNQRRMSRDKRYFPGCIAGCLKYAVVVA